MKLKKVLNLLIVFCLISIFFTSCDMVENIIIGQESDIKLFRGIQNANIEEIKEALQEGANINKFSGYKIDNIPLWKAISGDFNYSVFKLLVMNGADINDSKSDGTTPLMYFAHNTEFECCELLIKYGADVNMLDDDGYSALDFVLDHNRKATAIEKNIDKIVTLLIENGAKPSSKSLKATMTEIRDLTPECLINKKILNILLEDGIESGLNPALEVAIQGDTIKLNGYIREGKIEKEEKQQILFFTCAFGKVDTIDLLGKGGANLEIMDKNSRFTPLIIASNYGNYEIVKYLITRGVDIEAHGLSILSKTALSYAVENNQYKTAEILIKAGAKMTAELVDYIIENGNMDMMNLLVNNGFIFDTTLKGKALVIAAENDNIDFIKYFLDLGVDINGGYNSKTALFYATKVETIKYLYEKGANINRPDGQYSLAKTNSIEILKYYLEHGGDVNAYEKYEDGSRGITALRLAIVNGRIDFVKLLIENGADIECICDNTDENTSVMTAAYNGSSNILKYLIDKGAKLNTQNINGKTALMLAASNGQYQNVRILIENNSKKNIKDNDGKTALDLAKENKHKEIVSYLQNNK